MSMKIVGGTPPVSPVDGVRNDRKRPRDGADLVREFKEHVESVTGAKPADPGTTHADNPVARRGVWL